MEKVGAFEVKLAKSTGSVVTADQRMCCSIDVGSNRVVVHRQDTYTDAHHHKIATKLTYMYRYCSVSLEAFVSSERKEKKSWRFSAIIPGAS